MLHPVYIRVYDIHLEGKEAAAWLAEREASAAQAAMEVRHLVRDVFSYTFELIPTRGALFPRGGPVQDPVLTPPVNACTVQHLACVPCDQAHSARIATRTYRR